MRKASLIAVGIIGISLTLSTSRVHAAEYFWVGGGQDKNWTTPQNWLPAGIPGIHDRVILNEDSKSDCILDMPGLEVISLTLARGFDFTLILDFDLIVGQIYHYSGDIESVGIELAQNHNKMQ